MRTLDLITLMDPEVVPAKTKLHLATWNGVDDPLTVFGVGEFEEWQLWQARKNFEREFVIALIAMPEPHQWMYGGTYRSRGCEPNRKCDRDGFLYDLEEHKSCAELKGRMVSRFERPGRQSYLNADAWIEQIALAAVTAERMSVGEFPGFKFVHVSKAELDSIVRHRIESWHAALSSVGGVYLLSDEKSGGLYVGSASGEGGFWQRWTQYSETGHAGNIELKRLIQTEGPDRASTFRFSILEIADVNAKEDFVLKREAHWKRILFNNAHRLNAN